MLLCCCGVVVACVGACVLCCVVLLVCCCLVFGVFDVFVVLLWCVCFRVVGWLVVLC